MRTSTTLILILFGFVTFGQNVVRKKIPLDIQLKNRIGETIKMADISIDADYILMDFWSIGCKPCIVQLTLLARCYDSLVNRGIKIIAISTSPPSVASERWIEKYKWPFEVYYDVSLELFKKYSPKDASIPLTYIFDSEWKVVYKERGAPMKYVIGANENITQDQAEPFLLEAIKEASFDKLEPFMGFYYDAIDEDRRKKMKINLQRKKSSQQSL